MTENLDSEPPREVPEPVLSELRRPDSENRPIVAMICGIAGSGKSTLSKNIVREVPGFSRLSVDVLLHETRGLYGIDYPEDKYGEYLDEAAEQLKVELIRRLHDAHSIALDLSFWNKEYREEYKEMITKNGGRWVLIFMDAKKEVLQSRIAQRRAKRDALGVQDAKRDGDSAYTIDEATFEMYWEGFERPEGEGEIVVNVN